MRAKNKIKSGPTSAIAVSDAEILSALALVGRLTGIFVEPSSAAAVAGLAKERQAGRVADDECAVLLLTGTGLKDIAAARRSVEMPPSIDPNFQAFEEALA